MLDRSRLRTGPRRHGLSRQPRLAPLRLRPALPRSKKAPTPEAITNPLTRRQNRNTKQQMASSVTHVLTHECYLCLDCSLVPPTVLGSRPSGSRFMGRDHAMETMNGAHEPERRRVQGSRYKFGRCSLPTAVCPLILRFMGGGHVWETRNVPMNRAVEVGRTSS